MSRSWAKGSTRRYRELRAAILAANRLETGGACQLNVGKVCPKHARPCRNVCTGQAEQAHHVKGKEFGDDPKWMIPACAACNSHVGAPGKASPRPKRVSRW